MHIKVGQYVATILIVLSLNFFLPRLMPGNPLAQLDVAFENVAGNLRAAGMGLSDIIKVTYYHVGRLDRGRRLAVIVKHLGEHKPASTLLYVAGLADPAYLVEVEVWAAM